MKAHPDKVKLLKNFPDPASVSEVNSFRCLANWLAKFIPRFATIAAPLGRFARRGAKFGDYLSDPAAVAAVRLIRDSLSEVMLHTPRDGWVFVLYVDASDLARGWVLSQENPDGKERIIIDAGWKTFQQAECHWSTTEKEMSALREAILSSAGVVAASWPLS